MWVFAAAGVTPVSGWSPEPGLEVVLATPAELSARLAEGTFDHALHVAALQLAVHRGLINLPVAGTGNRT
jgi:hypothetical protein